MIKDKGLRLENMIAKFSDTSISPHLKFLKKKFPEVKSYQLTYNAKKDYISEDGIRVIDAYKGLKEIFSCLE